MALAEQVEHEGRELPPNLNVATEIAFRQDRLANLAEAKQVMEARAQERYQAEKAAYEAKQREREEAAKRKGKPPGGRGPQPPSEGPVTRINTTSPTPNRAS